MLSGLKHFTSWTFAAPLRDIAAGCPVFAQRHVGAERPPDSGVQTLSPQPAKTVEAKPISAKRRCLSGRLSPASAHSCMRVFACAPRIASAYTIQQRAERMKSSVVLDGSGAGEGLKSTRLPLTTPGGAGWGGHTVTSAKQLKADLPQAPP